MERCMVTLVGTREIEIMLLSEDWWDWLFDEGDLIRDMKKTLIDDWRASNYTNQEYTDERIIKYYTDYKGPNDRAMALPFKCYHSVKEVIREVKEQNIEIVEEFIGCIY